MIRGIIMQLVEMCLQVHDVLRLKASFVDPHVSLSEFVRDFGINVLRLTEAIRMNKKKGIFSFYDNKLFLIFQEKKLFNENLEAMECVWKITCVSLSEDISKNNNFTKFLQFRGSLIKFKEDF
ncbi:uncharacterized protein LOC111618691 isoform X2 [Centruroides sculpturatus]|nr:uncharacterized protein LOC111618691 isoform X2 [Centruroides sculpturatus]